MPQTLSIPIIGVIALLANVPLGVWRTGCRKYSPAWFVAIHASIPLIVAARLVLGVRWPWIPLYVALAIVGQLIGGSLRRDRRGPSERRRSTSDRRDG